MTIAACRRRRQWDKPDVRIRPGKGLRPRARDRLDHTDAQQGMVVTKDRGRWGVVLDNTPDIVVTCMRAREPGRTNIVVNDHVGVVGDVSGHEDTLAHIVGLAGHSTVLCRTANGNGPYERAIVASTGLLLIACAVADPEPRTDFTRYALVTAYAGGVHPVLCPTRSDLTNPQEFVGEFSALGVDIVIYDISDDLTPLLELVDVLKCVTALVGRSGVGKSTLVNWVVPEVSRETGEVSGVGKGCRTPTQSVALILSSESVGGATSQIINTPDIRSFGLVHVTPETLLTALPDVQTATDECPRGCTYPGPSADPECILDKLEGVQHRRVMTVRHLLSAVDGNEGWELNTERDQSC